MILGYSSFVLSSVKNLREHYIRVHKVFWQLLWKLQGHFFRTYKVIENTNFWKIGNLSSEAKILSHSSFVLLSVTNLRELFIRVHKVLWQILWELQGRFFRTKEVIVNPYFLKKKAVFPVKKRICPILFSYYRVWQNSGNNLKVSKKFFANTVEITRSFF